MARSVLAAAAGLLFAAAASGQHSGHAMPGMEEEEVSADRNLFASDMGRMTGMMPVDSMSGMAGAGWHVMDLGILHLTWDRQAGPSGGSEIESSNWNMVHAGRSLAGGRLSLMMMNSLEPATYPARGSRELFQTGEAYRGEPLVDRQHPHDFFMNLSATWRHALGAEGGAWIQAAPVGEPASGPIAFMHRASAGDNPAAPIGHHWQDSTHISFHVLTAGAGFRWIGVEGSVFRGREPDEHRWNIEGGRIDSAAVRAKLDFGGGWSGEISHAFLKHPEPLEPGDTHRTTAALYYGAGGDRPLAATVVWGENRETAAGRSESLLAEAAWQATASDQIYGRVEWVEKDRDLLLTKRLPPQGQTGIDLARIFAGTAGYVRDFDLVRGWKTGVGGDATLYAFPRSLRGVYGRTPVSTHVFLRARWGSAHGGAHAGHAGMSM